MSREEERSPRGTVPNLHSPDGTETHACAELDPYPANYWNWPRFALLPLISNVPNPSRNSLGRSDDFATKLRDLSGMPSRHAEEGIKSESGAPWAQNGDRFSVQDEPQNLCMLAALATQLFRSSSTSNVW
jgi:hypothetical protein